MRPQPWLFAVFLLLPAAVLATSACGKSTATVHIGYQKFGILLLLKERGTVERALEAHNAHVEWSEFPSGPPMMEALQAGKIDFGVAGEAPPVFAQANGAPIVYVACDPPAPRGEAILVHKDSPYATVADLRGKTIALNRGANVHYFLAAALASAHVGYGEVKLDFLPPSDARPAFEGGKVDAWAVWDPFLASALRSSDARVLVDGSGVVQNVSYYLATSSFARARPDLLRAIVAQIKEVDAYVGANRLAAASTLAAKLGLPAEALEESLARNAFDIRPISPDVVANQQKVADTFFELGLLNSKVRIADLVSRGILEP